MQRDSNTETINKMRYIMNMRPVLNMDALFSDGSEYYRIPAEPVAGETVRIRFRTQRNNVDGVFLVAGSLRIQMELCASGNGFDYYEAELTMPEKFSPTCGSSSRHPMRRSVSRSAAVAARSCLLH